VLGAELAAATIAAGESAPALEDELAPADVPVLAELVLSDVLPLPLERHAARLIKQTPATTPDSSLRFFMTLP
jgi:hypothetical protein